MQNGIFNSNYDFVRFQAFIPDEGWVSLSGQFTETWSGQPAQPFGEPGYDGFQEDWVEEKIFLDQLNGLTFQVFVLFKLRIIMLRVMVLLLIIFKF